jgi:hypothetical protein
MNEDTKTDANPNAVVVPVERQVRPMVARLRLHADNKTKQAMQRDCQIAADELDRLYDALDYASSGFALAYDAAEKRLNDEVLLHCGHHQARVDKARSA